MLYFTKKHIKYLKYLTETKKENSGNIFLQNLIPFPTSSEDYTILMSIGYIALMPIPETD